MRVTIADNAGFCFGVKRAVDVALKEKDSFSLGPLIHNPQTIKELERRGIKAVNSIEDINKGTLLIRTHGIPKSVIKKAEEKGLNVVDLTCPFVKNAQNFAKDFYNRGYKVIIIGEANHPEVIGIKGNIKGASVVENIEDAKKISFHNKIGVVVQTTQSMDTVNDITNKLKERCNELKIAETICNATTERQDFARELAKRVDLMIVIGGKESANTRRLFEMCNSRVETKFVESLSDLRERWFKNKSHIGITAGASTPRWLIKKIAEKIKNEI